MDTKDFSARYEYADNPRKKASLLSQLFYCWIIPLLRKGYFNDLVEDDLFEPLNEHKSNGLGDKLEEAWKKECLRSKDNPSLWKALIKVFGVEFGLYGLCLFFVEGCKLLQPIFLGNLLSYFQPNQTSITKNDAIIYAGIILIGALFSVVIGHAQLFGLQQIGMKVRVACSSLIYRKSLKLSKKALVFSTAGQMINMVSNDVNRFDYAVINVHNIWFVPIEVTVISYLLYHFTGWTAGVGVAFLILYLPMQTFLGKRYAMLRSKTAARTDERVRLMNEIITGIQVIKMYAWECIFSKWVDLARRIEIKYIRKTSYINGVLSSLAVFSTRFTLFITLLTFILLGNSLNPRHVFVTYSFFHVMRQCLTFYFTQGISSYSETKISVARIEKFLMVDEVQEFKAPKHTELSSRSNNLENILNIRNASAKWSTDASGDTLSNITIELKCKDLLTIIGSVGSGKSSLLQLILKEFPLKNGDLECHGTISYAAQNPWLFGATVRQNILFGERYEKEKYEQIIKLCALEQDLNSFPFGDKSLVGERGIMVSGGQKARISLARAIYREADIYLLDDPLSAVDAQVGQRLFEECVRGYLKNKCVILVTHQLQYLKNIDNIILMDNGQIRGQGDYKQIQALNFDLTKFMTLNENQIEKDSDKCKTSVETIKDHKTEQKGQAEIRPTGRIKDSVYITYIKSMGNYCSTAFILSFFLLAQIASSGSDYYLTHWISYEQNLQQHQINSTNSDNIFYIPRSTHVLIYLVIIVSIIVLALSRSIGFFFLSTVASVTLHKKMFGALVKSPMSFFHHNASGRILNRFSKDVGSLDQTLPSVLADSVTIGLNALGVSLLVGLINPWFLLVSCSMMVLFYFMKIIYLKTSTVLKRLESSNKSPIFNHITESLQGLTTIRAFNVQSILINEFDIHQDTHSSAWFMHLATSKIFGFYLDMVCILYVGIVTFSLVLIDSISTGENVGLAITQAMTLTGMFQWGMRQWSEVVIQMTSVERIVEYTNLLNESDIADSSNTNNWPTNGHIEFNNLSLRYTAQSQNILNNLNFIIESQEKIGVVGRTGAGKTSLIAALFRLAETDGKILIDGVNIRNLPLSNLRAKLSIIPQEPVLFSGTLRINLDPFNEFQDIDLWNALEEVKMKKTVNDLPSDLNAKVLQGGSNFSVGQRQLICLARAILRKNKILILDEATSNVDAHTDHLIQQTIRTKFGNCTVITIAHRLNTIIDSDKVLVIDNGYIKEFDRPEKLLLDKEGAFSMMVAESAEHGN